MKEIIDSINWKKVRQAIYKTLFIIILNTPLWVFLIGSMVPYGTIGEFRLSWIDYLKLSDKVEWYHIWFLYIFVAIGIILSIMVIKWIITAAKREKDKQEMLSANKANTQEIIEAINKQKSNKDIDKYMKG